MGDPAAIPESQTRPGASSRAAPGAPRGNPAALGAGAAGLVPPPPLIDISRGRFRARLAGQAADLHRAQALRARAFRRGAPDGDGFDPLCHHLLVEDRQSGALLCCARLLPLASGAEISRSYSAHSYDLSRLSRLAGPMAEVGRFCLDPDHPDPDILRLAWAALTAYVDTLDLRMLFGCASFAGTDPAPYAAAFARLAARHLAPPERRAAVKAEAVHPLSPAPAGLDPREGLRAMPPLLKTYLAMGGQVSDHAVVDREMNTLHVFITLEIATIPPARQRLLRALAG